MDCGRFETYHPPDFDGPGETHTHTFGFVVVAGNGKYTTSSGLASNSLTGQIPTELGLLSQMRVLNLRTFLGCDAERRFEFQLCFLF